MKQVGGPARPDALAIWGAELLLVGWLVAVIAWRVRPAAVLGMGAAIAVALPVLGAALNRSVSRPTALAIFALCVSFASTLPGALFFADIFVHVPNGRFVVCYERPSFSASSSWLLVGPALFVVSMALASWRQSRSLLIARAVNAAVFLVVGGNTFLCGLTSSFAVTAIGFIA